MKDPLYTPCAAWMEKLAVRYPDDLSYADRLTLSQHLAECPACTAVHAAYQAIGTRLLNLPTVEPLPNLPHELLQPGKHIASYPRGSSERQHMRLQPFMGTLFFRCLCLARSASSRLLQTVTMMVGIILYPLFHAGVNCLHLLERVFAALLAYVPHKNYMSSADNYLYVFESGGGTMLWKYKKSNVFFSSPAMAQGVPYVTGFDSQIFLFAALLHLKPGGDSFLWKH